jgi:hypothetical protein
MSNMLLMKQAPSVLLKDGGIEQRTESRFHCPRLARVRPRMKQATNERLSIVRNISPNGIGLFLTNALDPGTLVDVELRSRFIVRRVAKVVHSTRQEGGWLIGCTLDNPLSEAEVEALRT